MTKAEMGRALSVYTMRRRSVTAATMSEKAMRMTAGW